MVIAAPGGIIIGADGVDVVFCAVDSAALVGDGDDVVELLTAVHGGCEIAALRSQ